MAMAEATPFGDPSGVTRCTHRLFLFVGEHPALVMMLLKVDAEPGARLGCWKDLFPSRVCMGNSSMCLRFSDDVAITYGCHAHPFIIPFILMFHLFFLPSSLFIPNCPTGSFFIPIKRICIVVQIRVQRALWHTFYEAL